MSSPNPSTESHRDSVSHTVEMTNATSPGSQLSELLDTLEHTYGTPSSTYRDGGEPEDSTAASLRRTSGMGTSDPIHSFADVHLVQAPMTLKDAKALLSQGNPLEHYKFRSYATRARVDYLYVVIRNLPDGTAERFIGPEQKPQILREICDKSRRMVHIYTAKEIALYTCLYHKMVEMEQERSIWPLVEGWAGHQKRQEAQEVQLDDDSAHESSDGEDDNIRVAKSRGSRANLEQFQEIGRRR
ncbi:hypothetical protein HD553DRAFT_350454 [Filobasidium floriforme]|uniref:uncharacterized protein n=1 Tax=Filobasidium floriforme TaxID=5210 RepID=UPI001E8D87AD|nr:uncharacterized protein HD553DRAFT_350454 [Filobasidium floriforme]KAH8084249.1 hypothetical protein HD553DRAFT_350454 [Filobasidium floriforme]